MKPFEETIPNLDLLTIFMESVDRPPKVGFHLVYRHMHSLGKGFSKILKAIWDPQEAKFTITDIAL